MKIIFGYEIQQMHRQIAAIWREIRDEGRRERRKLGGDFCGVRAVMVRITAVELGVELTPFDRRT